MISFKIKIFVSQDVDAWQECEVVVVEDMASLINRVHEKCAKAVPSVSFLTGSPHSSDSHIDEDPDRYTVRIHEELLRHPSEMSVEETIVENKKRDVNGNVTDVGRVREFATAKGVSLAHLKQLAKVLGLAVTQSKRQSSSFVDRQSFGFPKSTRSLVVRETNTTPPRTLFKFRGRKDGLFFASKYQRYTHDAYFHDNDANA